MKKRILAPLITIALSLCPLSIFAGTFTIPDWVMKSCVFVMKNDRAVGTGFLIGIKEENAVFCYFVTAKHVMQATFQGQPVLSLRLNKKQEGGAEVVEFPLIGIEGKPWIEHGNPSIDLAVVPLAIFGKVEKYDVYIHTIDSPTNDYFATQAFIEKYKIRPGDSVFTLGLVPFLFSKDSENIIMTRSGTISMVGSRELPLPGGKQKAHFLDCAAFAGQSGGPAFVLLERTGDGGLLVGWQFALLGVVTEFVPSPIRKGEIELSEKEKRKIVVPMENTGISKVVPVDYLVDILFSQTQKEFREKVVESKNKSSKP